MQGLEKILEEIGELRGQAGSECTSEDHYIKKAWEHCLDRVVGIIRKHLNDDWIPVDDRDHMPEVGEYVLVSIGTGFNPEKAFLSEDGRWMMLHAPDGYNDITDEVEAWMPLPDSYRPERSVEECREAIEKQIAKRPVWKKGRSVICKDYADGHGEVEENKWADWVCPNCGWFVGEQYIPRRHNQQKSNYCSRCGQAIQWEMNRWWRSE